MQYDYRVVPAPTKGLKSKGAKSPEQRFAAAIEASLNNEAETGWEFVRAETLPSTERQGLTGSKTVYQTLLVFRRPAQKDASKGVPHLIEDQSQSGNEAGQTKLGPAEQASLQAER